MAFALNTDEEEGEISKTPVKYVPLCDVYSATAPCVSASGSSMSKKVTARKLPNFDYQDDRKPSGDVMGKPPVTHVYSRRRNRCSPQNPSFFNDLTVKSVVVKTEVEEGEGGGDWRKRKRRKMGCSELINLGVDSSVLRSLCSPRESRSSRKKSKSSNVGNEIKPQQQSNGSLGENAASKLVTNSGSIRTKKWAQLKFDGDPKRFVGLQCKVYWPMDDAWYSGFIVGYNLETYRHHVRYKDGDEEDLILANERTKIFISPEEMNHLKLSYGVHSSDTDSLGIDEMVVLAASLDDGHDLDPGDIIWAKISGHAMWPAIVLDESVAGDCKGLNKISGEKSVVVQFFGTHDFARLRTKQAIPFLEGLLSAFHLKCKKSDFARSMKEAKTYLSNQKLPKRMLRLQKRNTDYNSASGEEEGSDNSGDEGTRDEGIQRNLEGLRSCPFEIGDLQVQSLGKIVKDLDCFYDDKYICPEGYTALRKFPSILDPSVCTSYKMEVLRDADAMSRPLFRVTSDNGEKFEGSTSSSCWDKICRRIRKKQIRGSDALKACAGYKKIVKSGPGMFGFSHPEILKLIQLSTSTLPSNSSTRTSKRYPDLPVGYRPVHVKWKDLDKCNVCHMDEEYENNLFLQCDKCRMMVHARCYGELEPVDGVLWLCNLCRSGAPDFPPPCCLCPVIGGAMKPTTDGRWAHLACAIWIPETCLSDVKKMEPIDGLSRINKDRWKLLCSICGVSYGACIQCSNSTCYVAYHPLCARAAGFCIEPDDEDGLLLIPGDEDEDNQCIRLLSFCKRHRPLSNERFVTDDRTGQSSCQYSDYIPPPNPSGCARTEAYNYFGRRGRKEPEAPAAVSLKRAFVENRPYLVGGYSQHDSLSNMLSSGTVDRPKLPFGLEKLKTSQFDASKSIFSVAEKYIHMMKTFRKRLAFGKSGIHGYGIFAKQPHKAGDMVIEYTGELVRPPIADRREHLIYNSFVGAGTYMFRIDDERVIDATRAGSIAHLINHSCDPNCYSRVISVNGDEHIIIFAKRDIKQWEELTYDYRFLSIDEQLACYCGFPRCRGVVNDIDAEEQIARLYVPRRDLIDWREE